MDLSLLLVLSRLSLLLDMHLNIRNCDYEAKGAQILTGSMVSHFSGTGGKYKFEWTPSIYICSSWGWFDRVESLWSWCLDGCFTTTLPHLSKIALEKFCSDFKFGSLSYRWLWYNYDVIGSDFLLWLSQVHVPTFSGKENDRSLPALDNNINIESFTDVAICL